MIRLLTDLLIAGLVVTVLWAVVYFSPVLIALFSPTPEDLKDVDRLLKAERDRQ